MCRERSRKESSGATVSPGKDRESRFYPCGGLVNLALGCVCAVFTSVQVSYRPVYVAWKDRQSSFRHCECPVKARIGLFMHR